MHQNPQNLELEPVPPQESPAAKWSPPDMSKRTTGRRRLVLEKPKTKQLEMPLTEGRIRLCIGSSASSVYDSIQEYLPASKESRLELSKTMNTNPRF